MVNSIISVFIFSVVFLFGLNDVCLSAYNDDSFQQSEQIALQMKSIKCAPELMPYLKAIQSVTEGRQLISNILANGPLKIQVERNHVTEEFSACWQQELRTISVNLAYKRTNGSIIGSLLFELHNASVTLEFDKLDDKVLRNKISKKDYVQAVEKLEYINSINAAAIGKIGVRQGVFPADAELPTYPNFEKHFYYQQIGGHSAVIAENYEILRRFAQ